MGRLGLLDQAAFLRLRATGQGSAAQCTWLYDRDVNVDELRAFTDHLSAGLLGRRIERSPLPFGRHRWVLGGRPPPVAVEPARPRWELGAWVEQRAQVPVDPEHGPAFHLGVLPLDDGGAAVTLVASHCVVDGLAFVQAITEGVKKERRNLGYPLPGSRTRWRAVAEDLAEALLSLPTVLRALLATLVIVFNASPAKVPRSTRKALAHNAVDDVAITLPAVTLQTDNAAWEARARSLDGSSNALFVAFAARLADRAGRVLADGHTATIVLPVSERTSADDDRANALTSITLAVDARAVATELGGVRSDLKGALSALRQQPNAMLAGLPLVPFTPRWLVRRAEDIAMSVDQLPVGCSNLGVIDTAVGRIDGADATEIAIRLVEQGATRRRVEEAGGQLFCATGKVGDARFLTVAAYHEGAENTAAAARELACGALADLGLRADSGYEGQP
ncbi:MULTISPECIES: hypothetical protein [unclassified Mycobacterium]|uniref:hypothetical protein n=1 Tax=unclassified Mycobacterium TaxID=2642494 RepID=UPI0007FE3C65|nr:MULTISPECIES: hypothetical protein [unclassified Mycobacterium]OBG71304.1 hypothetical protein A5700_12045 [Mycobacterium sp. E1214]OBH28672.1 hypothetical protein A5693_21360 [Mycobacterium sp. E1319]